MITLLVSMLTNVSLEHTRVLGRAEAIAGEKVEIIKPGVPVVTAATDPAVLQVILLGCRAGPRLTGWAGRGWAKSLPGVVRSLQLW